LAPNDINRLRTVRERTLSEEVSKTASLILADHHKLLMMKVNQREVSEDVECEKSESENHKVLKHSSKINPESIRL
jgi:hypothetical protein